MNRSSMKTCMVVVVTSQHMHSTSIIIVGIQCHDKKQSHSQWCLQTYQWAILTLRTSTCKPSSPPPCSQGAWWFTCNGSLRASHCRCEIVGSIPTFLRKRSWDLDTRLSATVNLICTEFTKVHSHDIVPNSPTDHEGRHFPSHRHRRTIVDSVIGFLPLHVSQTR